MQKIKTLVKYLIGFYKYRVLWIKFFKVQVLHNKSKIEQLKNKHKGRTIFCLGAGPSLNNENIQLLDNQIIIFAHSSYKKLFDIKGSTNYWFVQDQYRLKEFKDIDRGLFENCFKTTHNLASLDFSTIKKEDIFIKPEFKFVSKNKGYYPVAIDTGLGYQDNISKNISLAGDSIIFTIIQMAKYMGAKKIVLLGVDMNYGIGIKDSYFDEVDTNLSFHPINYENGYAKQAFNVYNRWMRESGIKLINASVGTKDDTTPKSRLFDLIKT